MTIVISFVIIFRNHFFPVMVFRNHFFPKRASEEVTSPLKSVAFMPARCRPMPHAVTSSEECCLDAGAPPPPTHAGIARKKEDRKEMITENDYENRLRKK